MHFYGCLLVDGWSHSFTFKDTLVKTLLNNKPPDFFRKLLKTDFLNVLQHKLDSVIRISLSLHLFLYIVEKLGRKILQPLKQAQNLANLLNAVFNCCISFNLLHVLNFLTAFAVCFFFNLFISIFYSALLGVFSPCVDCIVIKPINYLQPYM